MGGEMKRVSISEFRSYSTKDLRAMSAPAAVELLCGEPLVVLIPYQQYMAMQRVILAAYGFFGAEVA